MRSGLSGASTISVRRTSAPSPTRCVRHAGELAVVPRLLEVAHVAQSGIAQSTIASESLVIATRNAPIARSRGPSTAGTPISRSASRKSSRRADRQRHELVRVDHRR